MFRNDGERRSFSISRDMTVIGRRQDCDLMIPLGEISRKHCRIIRDADSLRIEDLGSSNGTFVNGRRVQEAVLEPGDTVQVGPVMFVMQIDGVPGDDDIRPNTRNSRAGAGAADEDELQTLDDDELDAAPTSHLGADDLEAGELEADDGLETIDNHAGPVGLDDDAGGGKSHRGNNDVEDDDLEVLSEDTGGPGLDLDAEIGENLRNGGGGHDDEEDHLGGSGIDTLEDSAAGEITLDDKPKRRGK
ncbi:MAG TPA: FHA domain-containing protein [Tepidisphaeraceae bacterium]|jgi:predicted component of type VI protein secretion system